jgi:hypothetical protein
VLALAAGTIISLPAFADDSLLSLSIGRDRAYAAGTSLGDESVFGASFGWGSSDGLGLDVSYLDLGDLQRAGPGTFGAHVWSFGVSYTIDLTRRLDATMGFGTYSMGSPVRDDHDGYWTVGARYWITRNFSMTARFQEFDDLLGETHKVSLLSVDWAF